MSSHEELLSAHEEIEDDDSSDPIAELVESSSNLNFENDGGEKKDGDAENEENKSNDEEGTSSEEDDDDDDEEEEIEEVSGSIEEEVVEEVIEEEESSSSSSEEEIETMPIIEEETDTEVEAERADELENKEEQDHEQELPPMRNNDLKEPVAQNDEIKGSPAENDDSNIQPTAVVAESDGTIPTNDDKKENENNKLSDVVESSSPMADTKTYEAAAVDSNNNLDEKVDSQSEIPDPMNVIVDDDDVANGIPENEANDVDTSAITAGEINVQKNDSNQNEEHKHVEFDIPSVISQDNDDDNNQSVAAVPEEEAAEKENHEFHNSYNSENVPDDGIGLIFDDGSDNSDLSALESNTKSQTISAAQAVVGAAEDEKMQQPPDEPVQQEPRPPPQPKKATFFSGFGWGNRKKEVPSPPRPIQLNATSLQPTTATKQNNDKMTSPSRAYPSSVPSTTNKQAVVGDEIMGEMSEKNKYYDIDPVTGEVYRNDVERPTPEGDEIMGKQPERSKYYTIDRYTGEIIRTGDPANENDENQDGPIYTTPDKPRIPLIEPKEAENVDKYKAKPLVLSPRPFDEASEKEDPTDEGIGRADEDDNLLARRAPGEINTDALQPPVDDNKKKRKKAVVAADVDKTKADTEPTTDLSKTSIVVDAIDTATETPKPLVAAAPPPEAKAEEQETAPTTDGTKRVYVLNRKDKDAEGRGKEYGFDKTEEVEAIKGLGNDVSHKKRNLILLLLLLVVIGIIVFLVIFLRDDDTSTASSAIADSPTISPSLRSAQGQSAPPFVGIAATESPTETPPYWIQTGSSFQHNDPGTGFGEATGVAARNMAIGAPLMREEAGIVYHYEKVNGTWLSNSTSVFLGNQEGGKFGAAIAMTDGILVVGAPMIYQPDTTTEVGATYCYGKDGNQWVSLGSTLFGDPGLYGAYEEFGAAVAISNNYNLVVGAPKSSLDLQFERGRVYAFKFDTDTRDWIKVFEDIGFIDECNLGFAVDISFDGSRFIAGAPGAANGYATVYEWNGSSWNSVMRVQGQEKGEGFGSSVAFLSADGSIVAIGAPYYGVDRGRVTMYRKIDGEYIQLGTPIVGNRGEFLGEKKMIAGGRYSTLSLVIGTAFGYIERFNFDSTDWVKAGEDLSSGYFTTMSSLTTYFDSDILVISGKDDVEVYEWM